MLRGTVAATGADCRKEDPKSMSTSYDAIIIGTGQAGPPLARRLVAAGMKVAIVERKRFGGTCVNNGCTPTKALVASAYAAHLVRRAAEYGITVPDGVRMDMKRVKARKDAIVATAAGGLEKSLKSLAGCTVYEGHARLTSPREVSVGGGAPLSAERIFLNVGGRATIPELPGLSEIDYLTNSSMMALDFAPPHLIIVGGSYVGLEFGQMYARFGSRVTVVEKAPRLIPREDEDVSAAVQEIIERDGVEVRLDATCIRVAARDGGIAVGVDCNDAAPEIAGTHLLLAVGRRPNTDDLGLQDAGVAQDSRGFIQVDDELRTNVPHIWALGDCNGKGAFTHTSYNDFEIVAANLLDGEARRVSTRVPTFGLFIDPPLGRVGLTAAEVRRSGRPALVGQRPMTKVSRAIEKGETQGFMKIIVAADGRKEILGAAILGPGGDEAVHCVHGLMYLEAPYTVLQHAVHIHPTVAELVPTILGELKPLRAEESGPTKTAA
jgi:pyruvate/2-oxoglutarate dehydrogenase complex dihydrolipoamide dehydrogenase (E3) component